MPTSEGMTHTLARRDASAAGTRGITMPGVTESMLLEGGSRADYRSIARATESLAERLNGTNDIRMLSDAGTDLVLDVRGGEWFAERGLCDRPGDLSNFPGGEVSMVPVNAEGVLVIDGSINHLGFLQSPLKMIIKDRRVVSIEGNRAEELVSFLERFGSDAFNIAEIGIGMNPRARMCGTVLEDEKVLGTTHIGFGDNSNMGGKTLARLVSADVHIDGVVVSNPKLFADGVQIDPRKFANALEGKRYGEKAST